MQDARDRDYEIGISPKMLVSKRGCGSPVANEIRKRQVIGIVQVIEIPGSPRQPSDRPLSLRDLHQKCKEQDQDRFRPGWLSVETRICDLDLSRAHRMLLRPETQRICRWPTAPLLGNPAFWWHSQSGLWSHRS